MLKAITIFNVLALVLFQSVCFAESGSPQTIVGAETEGYFYADGQMKKSAITADLFVNPSQSRNY